MSAVAACVVLSVLVSGCAETGEGTAGTGAAPAGVTLAESKSYAQLLRNEASSRLPAIVLKEVSDSTDVSVACEDETDDPAGLTRSWSSSTRILITNSTASRIQKVADDLAQTFIEQDWTAELRPESTETVTVTGLTSETSLASIEIVTASKATEQPPSITITATGVCARTGGPESDEVVVLEGRESASEG